MQEAQNSSFTSNSSEPVISKEIPFRMTSGSPKNWEDRGQGKQTGPEPLQPSTEDSILMAGKAKAIYKSLLPTSCLSPTGSILDPHKETFEIRSPLRTSISRKSLKEIPQENSDLIAQTLVSVLRNGNNVPVWKNGRQFIFFRSLWLTAMDYFPAQSLIWNFVEFCLLFARILPLLS